MQVLADHGEVALDVDPSPKVVPMVPTSEGVAFRNSTRSGGGDRARGTCSSSPPMSHVGPKGRLRPRMSVVGAVSEVRGGAGVNADGGRLQAVVVAGRIGEAGSPAALLRLPARRSTGLWCS